MRNDPTRSENALGGDTILPLDHALGVVLGEGLERQHARAAIEEVSVGSAERDLELDMRDAEGIGRHRQHRRRLDHLVVVDPAKRRAGTDVFEFSSAFEEHAVERPSGFADVELTRQGTLVHHYYHSEYANRFLVLRRTRRPLKNYYESPINIIKTNNLL